MSAFFAVLVGTVLAVLLFVPFVYINYRRHGRLSGARTLLWIAFLVYAMALWTYTLLPLPEPADIQCTSAQLRPFPFIHDIQSYPYSGPAGLVHNPVFMQVALNVLLFMPLGFFLRILWGRGVTVAALTGASLSALIEVTQVTGVWGIYPCAYRVFDVDDLLANTTGALVGGLLAAALFALRRRFFPVQVQTTTDRITLGRRLVGMVCDAVAMILLSVGAAVFANAWQLYVMDRGAGALHQEMTQQIAQWTPFILVGILTLVTGRTVGDHAVRLTFTAMPSGSVSVSRAALRYLAGIGGFQLLGLLSPADLLFSAVSLVLVLITRDRRGLPGVLSGTQPAAEDRPVTVEASRSA
ncbi:VanZ family protein [Nesterenkonia flava]|uniref:VanZ family protein n=1 Tax=Nesterenkonia flava TaxID=469799 RepID=A0ABU1FPS2_9MICC|nr:VanZ family protein [Nesterenkonia flava]MDR5710641.1 VanZ family protein [Nesterenkonia flava]